MAPANMSNQYLDGQAYMDCSQETAAKVDQAVQKLLNEAYADAKRLLQSDPEYFFRMAPYAMALGVSKPFARAFGRRKLVQCPYFLTRVQGKRTAVEWMSLMTKAVAIMDDHWQRSQKARWLAVRFR